MCVCMDGVLLDWGSLTIGVVGPIHGAFDASRSFPCCSAPAASRRRRLQWSSHLRPDEPCIASPRAPKGNRQRSYPLTPKVTARQDSTSIFGCEARAASSARRGLTYRAAADGFAAAIRSSLRAAGAEAPSHRHPPAYERDSGSSPRSPSADHARSLLPVGRPVALARS